jgi:hypothetical protein
VLCGLKNQYSSLLFSIFEPIKSVMRKRIRSIGEKIIMDSFPSLRGKKIHFYVIWLSFFGFSAWIPPFFRFIVISSRTRDFSDEVIKGIMAHELCHQERYLEMGTWQYLKFAIGFLFSKKVQAAEEKETDRLTIEKGYGRQLYELTVISRNDRNHENIIDNYLSPEEIKAYAMNIGKW